MSHWNDAKRKFGFNPHSKEPFRLSRAKIDLFIQCPRCFYIEQRLCVSRPKSLPFTLNNAVDLLMKKEFDIHRAEGSKHPLVAAYGLDAIPFNDPRMEEWRDAFKRGIGFLHKPTNLFLRGGVDDIWVTPKGELIIVDYKATSKEGEVTLDAEWQDGYKRQMEIYQWLFRQNGFSVSDTGYFVYVNGQTDKKAFDAKLEFDIKLIPYTGKTDWIEQTIVDLKACLASNTVPVAPATCEYCQYVAGVNSVTEVKVSTPKVEPKIVPEKEAPKTKKSLPADHPRTLF